jgi:hypothetical protein
MDPFSRDSNQEWLLIKMMIDETDRFITLIIIWIYCLFLWLEFLFWYMIRLVIFAYISISLINLFHHGIFCYLIHFFLWASLMIYFDLISYHSDDVFGDLKRLINLEIMNVLILFVLIIMFTYFQLCFHFLYFLYFLYFYWDYIEELLVLVW